MRSKHTTQSNFKKIKEIQNVNFFFQNVNTYYIFGKKYLLYYIILYKS